MLFKRRKAEGPAPEGAIPQQPPPAPDAVLRDDLGLHQLWYFERRLREEVARAVRVGGVFSLVVWQLQLLPGESLELEVVQRCASIISSSLREYDLATRVDEERCAALLLDADYQGAATVAHRIKCDLQVRIRSAGKWRAGVATFQRDGVDGDALIRAALRRLDEDAQAA